MAHFIMSQKCLAHCTWYPLINNILLFETVELADKVVLEGYHRVERLTDATDINVHIAQLFGQHHHHNSLFSYYLKFSFHIYCF